MLRPINTKIISFLNEVKRKNITQIEFVNQRGLQIDYFLTMGIASSKEIAGAQNNAIPLAAGFYKRIRQVYLYYKQHKDVVNHIEIFGGGRFGFIYAVLAKLFGFKILLVERGVMNEYIDKKNRFTLLKFSAFVQYKLADICWYKEFYMEPYLKRLGVKELNFIPNSIGNWNFERSSIPVSDRPTDFLWVNRIIPHRHIDWIIEISKMPEFSNKIFKIYGFLDDDYSAQKKAEILLMNLPNVTICDYINDVIEEFEQAKYFIFPSDYVFGNNSLLESMAAGVVPIITNVHGSNKLIQNGVNGIIEENQFEAYKRAMLATLDTEPLIWSQLSSGAIHTIQSKYSLHSFKVKLELLYQKIEEL